jgi:hypothetical protein
MTRAVSNLINVGLYQAGWFCCVLGAAWAMPLLGALLASALMAVHLFLAANRRAEVQLMLSSCLVGVVIDSLQQAAGVFTFKQDPSWPLWLPLWVFIIWAQFATLFHYALRWMSGRYLIAAVFGMIGGPLAYWAGVRLGAASFGGNPLMSMLCLAVVWTLVTPALLRLSLRFADERGLYRFLAKGD